MNIDDLVKVLAADEARPVLRFPARLVLAAVAGSLVSCILVLAIAGPRPDWATAMAQWHAPLKALFSLVLATAGLVASLRIAMPEVRAVDNKYLLAVAPLMLLAGVAMELAFSPRSEWLQAAVGTHPAMCLTVVPLLSLAPFAAMSYVMRDAAPGSPSRAGAMLGLAAGAMGAAAYVIRCTDDAPLFVVIWYGLAIALVSAAGYLGGSRLYRW